MRMLDVALIDLPDIAYFGRLGSVRSSTTGSPVADEGSPEVSGSGDAVASGLSV